MRVVNRLRVLERDDLKDIKGVQNVLEKVLHGLGIFTFRQIATWTTEEVEQVRGALLQFKGRIEREKWIEQSRDLHMKKYNEAL
jgi:predicted flap endonuclease-1-like 5' DNA nuclease